MRKWFVLLPLLLTAAATNKPKENVQIFPGVTTLYVDGCFSIELSADTGGKTLLDADPPFAASIQVKSAAKQLSFSMKDDSPCKVDGKRAKLTVSNSTLEELNLKGQNGVTGDAVHLKAFTLTSGGSNIIKLSGSAATFTLNTDGATIFEGPKFDVAEAIVDAKGSTLMDMGQMKKATIFMMGTGQLSYRGQPSPFEKKLLGSVTIRRM